MTTDPDVRVRRAAPRDAARIDALVRSLSPDSIVGRFMGGIAPDLAATELRREILATGSGVALVAENARGEIVGEAYAAMLTPQDAEAAFVVCDREQHHGVGGALFATMVAELRARGVATLHADTRSHNAAMLALLQQSGLPMRQHRADGCVHATLSIDQNATRSVCPKPFE